MKKSKPDLLLILALFIGLGIIATEVVQAFSGKSEPAVTTASR